MELLIEMQDGKKSIVFGNEIPDNWDDEQWEKVTASTREIIALIKETHDVVSIAEGQLKIDGQEFRMFFDDLMPPALYAENSRGN